MGVAVDESFGYAGDFAPNDVWARMQWGLGNRYWVYNNTNCVVSAKSDGTRQVNIAAGYMGGWGVTDRIITTKVLSLPAVVSGTKYFMIVARRTWGTAQATVIDYIDAGTTSDTLPARNTDGATPGASGIDDQPLALVSLKANDTIPTVVADLRVLGTADRGVALANSALVLQYLAFTGQTVRVGNTTYSRVLDSSGTAVWETDTTVTQSGPGLGNPLLLTSGPGWVTASELISTGTRSGNSLTLHLLARRSGAAQAFSDTFGSFSDAAGLVVTVGNGIWKPPRILPFTFTYYGTSGASYTAGGQFETDGQVRIIDGKAGTSIGQNTTSGGVSFRAHIIWNREA